MIAGRKEENVASEPRTGRQFYYMPALRIPRPARKKLIMLVARMHACINHDRDDMSLRSVPSYNIYLLLHGSTGGRTIM